MIPVSTLYNEYIDRRKLTEQKKPFEYIVPPPSRGVGIIICKIMQINLEVVFQLINVGNSTDFGTPTTLQKSVLIGNLFHYILLVTLVEFIGSNVLMEFVNHLDEMTSRIVTWIIYSSALVCCVMSKEQGYVLPVSFCFSFHTFPKG